MSAAAIAITDPITALVLQFAEHIAALVRAEFQTKAHLQASPVRLLTVKQAAEYIGRSESAMRHLIHNRDIPVVRKGRSVRIDRKDLDTWIENNKC